MTLLLLGAWSLTTLYLLRKGRRNYGALPSLPVSEAAPPPAVTVVIPARNEAGKIGRAAASFSPIRVIVVDDNSSDTTAAEALAAGAEVVPAPPLPPGAAGKPNACLAGARLASTDWVCFVDADTWFHPSFLPSLVRYAEGEKLEFVSAFLRSHRETGWEKLLLPYAFALYFVGVNAQHVNDFAAREALANGQCILFRTAAYRFLGGHGAVLGSVIEDVALALAAKRSGLRTRVLRAEHLGNVRMYDGLAAIWQGFRKNSFRFLLANPRTGVQVIAASVLLTSTLPLLFLAVRSRSRLTRWLGSFVVTATPAVGLWDWYEGPYALLSPLAIYLFQTIALDAMLGSFTRRKTLWKGRHV